MAGRRPKPTALKLLTGNPGKREINDQEPAPKKPGKVPSPPAALDKIAATEWRRLSKELAALGLLTAVDRGAFAGYCQSWSTWIDALEHVRDEGAVVKSPTGYPVQSPWLGIANSALKQMRAFLVEFGMTPSSRSKIKTGEKPPADPLDAFLDQKRGRA